MPVLRVATLIRASPEICFDLARDVSAHIESTAGTREKAVSGVTAGLMGLGDEVTVFDYQAPLGALGRLADRLFLESYMRRFLEKRAEHLRQTAEAYASRGRK